MCEIDRGCPDQLLSKCAHSLAVLTEDIDLDGATVTVPYSCALNQTDLIQNCNKFCVVQLLTRDNEAFFLVTRAGRVGYEGASSLDCFLDRETAINAFKTMFAERTGRQWSTRYENLDAPVPKGKYQYILMKYDNAATAKVDGQDVIAPKLPAAVDQLLHIIYDPDLYNEARSMGLDTRRLPLGDLGKAQISKAYKILRDLNAAVAKGPEAGVSVNHELVSLSALYYSTIPTASGMSKLPTLDTAERISEKMELLELLDNMCYLNKAGTDTYKQYQSLQCNIEEETNGATLAMIRQYLTTNAGHTHSYQPRIVRVYRIDRPAEKASYLPWSALHNRQLLWHGTRLSNAVGILSRGMQINPVGIATNGKMFGNGLYFANASTKSAQYMYVSSGGHGVLLLCEVALGNMYEITHATSLSKETLPSGKHSTRGLGTYQPNEHTHVRLADGVIVPIGKLEESDKNGKSLLYDEFIVYDPSQIALRYFVLVQ